ncbi:hypothetical protein [Hymenobacter sp. CRA2]|uniref:hypothetical protein n=1 Tax=Hymenobacter sp. CRA2 TaxID=1955620 RepID=UPI00098ED7B0|nr:hypothetical protein [Hymenobacter sp. CRA2]OON67088.1 hypothetical protein B0919_19860 [Hymenobacter sp. CRA2]
MARLLELSKRLLKAFGCLLAIPLILLLLVVLFGLGQAAVDAVQARVTAGTRVTISWPSQWGCDEFYEAYQMHRIEHPNALARWLFKGETLLVPYPVGRYNDTVAFHRYYSRLGLPAEDTIVVRGHFGDDVNVGERGLMYSCEAIPYFQVDAIYTQRGKLLRRFRQ